MTEERSSCRVDKFIDWLKEVMDNNRVTRVQLGQHLGAGGKDKIDEDLSGSYLPSWGYVVATYSGPIEKITDTTLAPGVVANGKQLYKTAAQVAKPSLPKEGVAESFSRVVAPVLAGLSLPAIVGLATATTPGKLSREVALSFLIMATGLFLASFQLTIGSVYTRGYNWGNLRAALSFLGIVSLIVALVVLVTAVGVHWWVVIAVIVLVLGGISEPFSSCL